MDKPMNQPTTGDFTKTPGWLDWYTNPSQPRFRLCVSNQTRRLRGHCGVVICADRHSGSAGG